MQTSGNGLNAYPRRVSTSRSFQYWNWRSESFSSVGVTKTAATKSKAQSFARGWIVTSCPHSPVVSFRLIPPSPSDARRFTYPTLAPIRDALIAATALVHGLTVATRNVADFERTGVSVLNPWEA